MNVKQGQTIAANLTDPLVRIADMDRDGIDVQAISPSPYHYNYGYPADATRQSCHMINDRIAEIIGEHPDRFVGMGTVPLQDGDMALAEALHRRAGLQGYRDFHQCGGYRFDPRRP